MSEDSADRLVRLEMAIAHLQHDFERLHTVALEIQGELRQLALRITRVEQQAQRLQEPPEPWSPGDERPPHY